MEKQIGDTPVTIEDIMRRMFGDERVTRYLKGDLEDEELDRAYMKIKRAVSKAWRSVGVDERMGPYAENR